MFNTIEIKFRVIDILLYKGCYLIKKKGTRGWFKNHNYIIGDEVTEYYKQNNLSKPYKIIINRKLK